MTCLLNITEGDAGMVLTKHLCRCYRTKEAICCQVLQLVHDIPLSIRSELVGYVPRLRGIFVSIDRAHIVSNGVTDVRHQGFLFSIGLKKGFGTLECVEYAHDLIQSIRHMPSMST